MYIVGSDGRSCLLSHRQVEGLYETLPHRPVYLDHLRTLSAPGHVASRMAAEHIRLMSRRGLSFTELQRLCNKRAGWILTDIAMCSFPLPLGVQTNRLMSLYRRCRAPDGPELGPITKELARGSGLLGSSPEGPELAFGGKGVTRLGGDLVLGTEKDRCSWGDVPDLIGKTRWGSDPSGVTGTGQTQVDVSVSFKEPAGEVVPEAVVQCRVVARVRSGSCLELEYAADNPYQSRYASSKDSRAALRAAASRIAAMTRWDRMEVRERIRSSGGIGSWDNGEAREGTARILVVTSGRQRRQEVRCPRHGSRSLVKVRGAGGKSGWRILTCFMCGSPDKVLLDLHPDAERVAAAVGRTYDACEGAWSVKGLSGEAVAAAWAGLRARMEVASVAKVGITGVGMDYPAWSLSHSGEELGVALTEPGTGTGSACLEAPTLPRRTGGTSSW